MNEIIKQLFKMQDTVYRDFHSRLMPEIDKDNIIGVRTPELRKFAKKLSGTDTAKEFIKHLPHGYYEENNLHAFLIEQIKDYDGCVAELERFLPFVDNWATCDMLRPKVFKKHLPDLREKCSEWIGSRDIYTVRFGIEMLMVHFLEEHFEPDFLKTVANVKSEEYYIRMMVAWYFATALAKQYTAALPYLEEHKLDKWTHNKTIQKATESYRITSEQKEYLRTLKRK